MSVYCALPGSAEVMPRSFPCRSGDDRTFLVDHLTREGISEAMGLGEWWLQQGLGSVGEVFVSDTRAAVGTAAEFYQIIGASGIITADPRLRPYSGDGGPYLGLISAEPQEETIGETNTRVREFCREVLLGLGEKGKNGLVIADPSIFDIIRRWSLAKTPRFDPRKRPVRLPVCR